jgi:hypothetical protein
MNKVLNVWVNRHPLMPIKYFVGQGRNFKSQKHGLKREWLAVPLPNQPGFFRNKLASKEYPDLLVWRAIQRISCFNSQEN